MRAVPAQSSPVAAAVVAGMICGSLAVPYDAVCSRRSPLSLKPRSSVLGGKSQEDGCLFLHIKSQQILSDGSDPHHDA